VVVGSGPAGEKAAAKAAYFGKRVALVERSEHSVGGVAVTRLGMIPTKTLREAALYLSGFRKREIYGAAVDLDPSVLHDRLHARTDAVSATMSRAVLDNIARHGIESSNRETPSAPCATISRSHECLKTFTAARA